MPESMSDHAEAQLGMNSAVDHFRFADLAPELRNLVYEKCLEDVKVRLPRLEPGGLFRVLRTVHSPLLLLNKKFGKEFRDLTRVMADIETTVVNYDFAHVYHFLRRNSGISQRSLESGAQVLTIELSLPSEIDTSVADTRLYQWLRNVGKYNRNGGRLDFRYVATPQAQIAFRTSISAWPPDRFINSRILRHPFLERGHDVENYEADKMRRALLARYLDYGMPGLQIDKGLSYAPPRHVRVEVALQLDVLREYRRHLINVEEASDD